MTNKQALEAGFGKADITPYLPVCTLCTRSKDLIADKIVSGLYARTTVFKQNNNRIVLISTDLLALNSRFTNKVKGKLKKLGLNPENILISCSHTHTSPNTVDFNGSKYLKADKKYLKFLEEKLVESVKDALKDLKPSLIGAAKAKVNLNVNRRQIGRMGDVNDLGAKTGLVDNEMGIIFIKQQNVKKGSVLVNYTAHPLSMGKKSSKIISADFPGELVKILEKDYKFAQFFQGAAGNINVKVSGGIRTSRTVGKIMADAVRKTDKKVALQAVSRIDMKTRQIKMPVDNIERLIKMHQEISDKEDFKYQWYQKAIKIDKNIKSMPVLIQALRIGNIYMAALPGEQFVETGLAIKKNCRKRFCFIIGYANCDEIGYVPTKRAFKEGGYEVDTAYKCYGEFVFRSSPEASEHFVKRSLKLLSEL